MTTVLGGCSITADRARALGDVIGDRRRGVVRSRRYVASSAARASSSHRVDIDASDKDGSTSIASDRSSRIAGACTAVMLSTAVSTLVLPLANPPSAAAFGEYGSGLGYFQRLEAERAVSEEPVPLSLRSMRRASSPSTGTKTSLTRGIPLSLGADDDDTGDDVNVKYTEPDFADAVSSLNGGTDEASQMYKQKRLQRAVFQWSVIFAVVYNAYRARTRGSAVTKRLGLEGSASTALVGTRWRLNLDIGRERGTWMPPEWGASGFRVLLPIAVELKENGVVEPIAIGGFAPTSIAAGSWRLEGDALKFDVKTSGMERGDISLPSDSLHFRTAAWGGTMASKGNLMLLQTRFGFRREWRMVGVFKAEPLTTNGDGKDGEDDGDDGDGDGGENNAERKVLLDSMRVTSRRTS